jgi:hypothetical protein
LTKGLRLMASVLDGDGHVRMSLGLYVLQALRPGECAAVEEHLACCVRCRDERTQLGDVPADLGLLSGDEARALITELGVASKPDPPGTGPVTPRRWLRPTVRCGRRQPNQAKMKGWHG